MFTERHDAGSTHSKSDQSEQHRTNSNQSKQEATINNPGSHYLIEHVFINVENTYILCLKSKRVTPAQLCAIDQTHI